MSEGMLGRIVQKLVSVPAEMLGVVYDLLEKLSGEHGPVWLRDLKRMLRKIPTGVPLIFRVARDESGTSGEGLLRLLCEDGYRVEPTGKAILRSREFAISLAALNNVWVIVMKGSEIELGSYIRQRAEQLGYTTPQLWIAPIIRLLFTDEDLAHSGLKALVVMHEPVSHEVGAYCLGLKQDRTLGLFGAPRLRREEDANVGYVFFLTREY